jgi:ABC-type lipoprotein release transport system permease subunit
MSKPHVKKPGHVLSWIFFGAITGICLGIITALIIIAIDRAYGEFPNGPPRWQVTERVFTLEALYLGFIGGVIGGIVGFFIWLYKSSKAGSEKNSVTSS